MGLSRRTFLFGFLSTGILCGCKREKPQTKASGVLRLEGIQAEIPKPLPPALEELHLRGVGASRVLDLHLPENLRALNLSGNALPALPEHYLPKGLRKLWLADNRLANLPRSFQALRALVYLNLDRNVLETLPKLDELPLRWLRLNGNRLSSLPPLPDTVERLYAANNRLTAVPRKSAALRHLTLARNPLDQVPDDLGAGLTFLDLSETSIRVLPQNLASWRTLKALVLSRCPLAETERKRIRQAFDPDNTTVLF